MKLTIHVANFVTALNTRYFVLIFREVSFGVMEHRIHSGYLLPSFVCREHSCVMVQHKSEDRFTVSILASVSSLESVL